MHTYLWPIQLWIDDFTLYPKQNSTTMKLNGSSSHKMHVAGAMRVQHFYHTRIIRHNPRERYATISGINIAGCFNIPCQSPQWWQCQYRIPSRIWSNTQLSLNSKSLQWRHNGHDSVSNHQPHHCFPFIQTQIKENTKASRHWPLCGELTGNPWIPRTNGQLRGKCFHLMTSS